MRRLIVTEFVSLDGVMEGPGSSDRFKYAGWTNAYSSEQGMQFKFDELMNSGALLLGRNTYDGFAEAWPGQSDEAGFADKMNSMPKYVVSNNLKKATWSNSHLITGDVAGKVRKLKQSAGQDILVYGSGLLVQELMRAQIIDEYHLLVYPLVLGSGKKLFGDGVKASLKLTETKAFDKGVVLLNYVPDKK
jgi:dihydrofolate reductase